MAGTDRNPRVELYKLIGTHATADDLLATASAVTTGTVWFPAQSLTTITASTPSVLTRNAVGDYSWNTTAGGAETHYFIARFNLPTRTTSGKGIKVTGGRLSYALGVVDATSVDVVLNQCTYANTVANAVAAHGGTLTYDAAHDSAAERKASSAPTNPHLLSFTLGTPVYNNAQGVALVMEAAFVLANTGTLKVQGFGIDFTVYDLGA